MSEVRELSVQEAETILFKNGHKYRKTAFVRAVQMPVRFSVTTHEGKLTAEAGDYLVQNITGESRPWAVKAKIFEQSYESVPF